MLWKNRPFLSLKPQVWFAFLSEFSFVYNGKWSRELLVHLCPVLWRCKVFLEAAFGTVAHILLRQRNLTFALHSLPWAENSRSSHSPPVQVEVFTDSSDWRHWFKNPIYGESWMCLADFLSSCTLTLSGNPIFLELLLTCHFYFLFFTAFSFWLILFQMCPMFRHLIYLKFISTGFRFLSM